MDDGSRTIFGLIDEAATGCASSTVTQSFQKPGRGAGNSINALIDAYRLSNERRYFAKAETLIQRVIHPKDDIAELQLNEPEYRWSYLVFLQVIGKYLEIKIELGETDYLFYYARDSLLHYADWMLKNEVPFKEVLHKVEYPTETWPAQDIRKSHVFYLAAKFGDPEIRIGYREKARFFFDRCLTDVLDFDTAYLTRPMVLLTVYGYVQAYFEHMPPVRIDFHSHGYNFGIPLIFVPQKNRIKQVFLKKIKFAKEYMARMSVEKWSRFKNRI